MTDDTDTAPAEAVAKREWITPRLELLGTMDEVSTNGAQPPNDFTSPSVAAS